MSLFSGGKSKDLFSKKSQFYVEFLGWMECRGLRGQRYTEPIMRELQRRQKRNEATPKLTIEVSKKDLKITQEVEETNKRGIKKIKFPTIPARDVTFVHQAVRPGDGRLDDIVACIYLGYMPRTQRYVHVHVYRFDEAKTATLFTNQMAAITENNFQRVREVEMDLASKGEIDDPRVISSEMIRESGARDSALGSGSSAYSDDDSPTFSSDEVDSSLQDLKDVQPFDSVADELKFRLHLGDTPLLLPPKDYDTIHRGKGNFGDINKRRCLNLKIVGENAGQRDRNDGSTGNESGVDLASPETENLEENGGNFTNKTQTEKQKFWEEKSSPRVSGGSSQQVFNPLTPRSSSSLTPRNIPGTSPAILKQTAKDYRYASLQSLSTGFPESKVVKSGRKTPEMTSPFYNFDYPPKLISPPLSPEIPIQFQEELLYRQTSKNDIEISKPIHFDENRTKPQILHTRGNINDDLYALPYKSPLKSPPMPFPGEELPPDYMNDSEDIPQLRGMKQRYGQNYLTRTKSDELTRKVMNLGGSSRRMSSDVWNLRYLSETNSPTEHVGRYGKQEHRNSVPQQGLQIGSSKR